MRGELAPHGIPLHRTPADAFDDLVLDAVEELEVHWSAELAGVEFAVEEVPPVQPGPPADFDHEQVVDRGVPLGRLYRQGLGTAHEPVIVVYRRPVEARSADRDDRGDLVFMVVAELVAELLGRDLDEIDPPRD